VAPPLLVTDGDIDAALAILAASLRDALADARGATGGKE
jgi:hypothetical protein